MRKEKNKRGKCPRDKTIQRIEVPKFKMIAETNAWGVIEYKRIKNNHRKAGRTLLVYHQKTA